MMATTEERADRLETAMSELADAQMRTQVSLKTLSDEMREFKDEMQASQMRTETSLNTFSESL